MSDSVDTSAAINVGDAVLRFLGDTTDLERAWTDMEEQSEVSAQKAVDRIGALYKELNIKGTVQLRELAQNTQEAYSKILAFGGSFSDLVQAEKRVLETNIALKKSLGEVIPPEILNALAELNIEYVRLTGTAKEYAAAQKKFTTVEQQVAAESEATAKALYNEELAYARAGKSALHAATEKKMAAEQSATAEEEGSSGGKGSFSSFKNVAIGLLEYQAIMKIVEALHDGFDAAMEFDKAFAELSTLIDTSTPAGVEQVAALKMQLLALPPVLGDITELTKATYEAISAGIPAAEAVEFVGKSAVFAKAALTDQFTSVKLITSAMAAYGLGVQDVDKVTSALFATIQNGKLRGPELAESLGRVLPVAANLGISLTQVLGAADALTQGGLSADEAMTALRQVLNTLERPTAAAVKTMASLHSSLGDVRQEIQDKGLFEALQSLSTKLKDNDVGFEALFGNIRARTGILTLLGPQLTKYKDDVAAITKAYNDGTAAQIAMDKITQSQSGTWETFGNTLKTKFITYWTQIAPITHSIGIEFSDLLLKTGLLKVLLGVLAGTLGLVALSLQGVDQIVTGLALGFLEVGKASTLASHALHLMSDGDYTTAMKAYSNGIQELKERIQNTAQAGRDVDMVLRGMAGESTKQTQDLKKFADAQLALAKATDERTAAEERIRVGQTKDQATADEKKLKLEELAGAGKKAATAMRDYASAHNIPLKAEFLKATDDALKFYEMLVRTKAPLEAQNIALYNYQQALSKLNELTDNKTGYFSFIQEMGAALNKGKDAIAPIAVELSTMIRDPLVDAFHDVLDAEQRLGIAGSVTLATYATNAEEAATRVAKAYMSGLATLQDLRLAEEELQRANEALAASMGIDLRTAMEKVADAEKELGVVGPGSLKDKYDALNKAMVDIKIAQKNGLLPNTLDLTAAQLKLNQAYRDYLVMMGKPVPPATLASIKQATTDIRTQGEETRKTTSIQNEWEDFWHTKAPSQAQMMRNLADIGEGAFLDMTKAIGTALSAWEHGTKSFGAALEEAVSDQLIAVSVQTAMQALVAAADGVFAAATGDEAAAALYFEAAAEYGAVAVAAGAAGMAMRSTSGSGGSSTSQPGSSGPTQSQINPTQTQNIQRFAGGGLVSQPTLALIGDSKASASRGAREGILPLDDPDALGQIGGAIAGAMGDMGGTHFHIQGLVSADTLDALMDGINTRVSKGKKLMATTSNRVTAKS